MSKYQPLGDHLQAQPVDHVPMTFAEVEAVLGRPLPPSKKYQAWWSNSPSNNPMTRVWLDAGFRTESVDPGREKLVFKRVQRISRDMGSSGVAKAAAPEFAAAPALRLRGNLVERVQAALGGTVTIPPGSDITQPSGEVWDAQR